MRRLAVPALVVLLAVLTGRDAALGATIRGTGGPDRLSGTASADTIYGFQGDDRLAGRDGSDLLHGGSGRDVVTGDGGHDRLALQGDGPDRAACGAGSDLVNVDAADRIAHDCEVVSLQLSRDPYATRRAQHETQVEPDSYAWGRTIVTAFQVGRFVVGGAANIGFATSANGGRSWRSGFLPGLSVFSTPPGLASFATDPVVAYDAAHRVWLIASLAASPTSDQLLISRSRDGFQWSLPVTAARAADDTYDKEWIACDNGRSSRYRGHCYLSYLDVPSGEIHTRTSRDGGLTWSEPARPPASSPRPVYPNGAQPVVRPNGTLVVVFADLGAAPFTGELLAMRSTDGGASFGALSRIAKTFDQDVAGVRAPPLPSVEVDAGGRVYVAWHDCRFPLDDCVANDIVLAASADGSAWTAPRRIPIRRQRVAVDLFVPGLAVDPTTRGGRARIAVAYHSLPQSCPAPCGIDVGVITSADGGASWSQPRRLSAQSMRLTWLADTGLGRMLGDYISTSFVGGRPVPVFSLASAPTGETFRQAIFAATRVRP